MTSSRRSIPTADRISDLPDSILCHILSFLSTKRAATTSVLSKRWKPLWLSVFTLDFNSISFIFSPFAILPAIHSTMLQRDITSPIHSFSFICRQYFIYGPNEIDQIIEFLVRQRRVQNFTLLLMVPVSNIPSIELPSSILNCDTLEVLKLKGVKFGDISHPRDLHLPKLKILHFNCVRFECNQQLYNLLLGCPLLQDFKSKHSVNLEEIETLHLPQTFKGFPNLIKARICEDRLEFPLNMIRNTKILYVDIVARISWFRNAPMFRRLTHLEIEFQGIINWYRMCMWLLSILKHSPKLQCLIIQGNRLLALWNDKYWDDPEVVPECLSSELKTCCISGYRGNGWEFKFAKYIIENSKVLNTMTIHSKCSIGMNDKEKMLDELSSCTKASTTCKLLFD